MRAMRQVFSFDELMKEYDGCGRVERILELFFKAKKYKHSIIRKISIVRIPNLEEIKVNIVIHEARYVAEILSEKIVSFNEQDIMRYMYTSTPYRSKPVDKAMKIIVELIFK